MKEIRAVAGLRENGPVADVAVADRIAGRALRYGVKVPAEVLSALAAYLGLLAQWNRRINLTALPLEPPTDASLDRLIIEPLVAAQHIPDAPVSVLDVGSGAGSPALPLKLMRPALRLVMVEARVRKSAFLREAVRALNLADARVETATVELVGQMPQYGSAFDFIILRAVRLDERLWTALASTLKPGGRLLILHSAGKRPNISATLRAVHELPGHGAELAIYSVADG